MSRRILVVGSGGREHALLDLRGNPRVTLFDDLTDELLFVFKSQPVVEILARQTLQASGQAVVFGQAIQHGLLDRRPVHGVHG